MCNFNPVFESRFWAFLGIFRANFLGIVFLKIGSDGTESIKHHKANVPH